MDEFDQLFDVEMKVTEYDIDDKVEGDVQAAYMTDFMTMIFSHPKMEAFLMWGFWDGNHWKGNAPMFDINWNLKPSGFAFNDLVFNEWWTNEDGTSATDGEYNTSVFKGEHTITVNFNNQTFVVESNITDDATIEVVVDPTAIFNLEVKELELSPNPNNGNFKITTDLNFTDATIKVLDVQGKLLHASKLSNPELQLDLNAGFYVLELTSNGSKYISKLIIE